MLVVVWNVKLALAAPPEGTLTLAGIIDHVGQLGQRGGGEVLRFTVVLKPLRLLIVMVVNVEDPAVSVWDCWLALITKSGVTGPTRDPF